MMYEEFVSITGAKKISKEDYDVICEPVYMYGTFKTKEEFADFYKTFGIKGCLAVLSQFDEFKELECINRKLTNENELLKKALNEEKDNNINLANRAAAADRTVKNITKRMQQLEYGRTFINRY